MKLSKKWTTVTPLSKTLALLLYFLLPVAGFYFGIQYQKYLTLTEPVVLEQRKSFGAVPINVDTTNWLGYKNSKWGFELKLPQSWKGYQVSEHDWTNSPNHEYTADICLYFERPDSIPACILQISVFSPSEWQALIKKGGSQPKLLGQSNQYFFTSSEYDPQCTQLDSFQCDRSKELLHILPTFTLDLKSK